MAVSTAASRGQRPVVLAGKCWRQPMRGLRLVTAGSSQLAPNIEELLETFSLIGRLDPDVVRVVDEGQDQDTWPTRSVMSGQRRNAFALWQPQSRGPSSLATPNPNGVRVNLPRTHSRMI